MVQGIKEPPRRPALVVAAFETLEYRFSMPASKADLLRAWDKRSVLPFREDIWPQGHRPIDYSHWRTASRPYLVDWQPDFEPYLVVQRTDLPLFGRNLLLQFSKKKKTKRNEGKREK